MANKINNFKETIRRRESDLVLYRRMLKEFEDDGDQMNALHVSRWITTTEAWIAYSKKRIEEMQK